MHEQLNIINHQKVKHVIIQANKIFVNAGRDELKDCIITPSAEKHTKLERERARDLTNILTT